MSDLPLTRPAPWEEIPENALFPVPSEGEITEVMVLVPEEGDRVVMHIVAAEEDAERAVLTAFRHGRQIAGYEMTVRAF